MQPFDVNPGFLIAQIINLVLIGALGAISFVILRRLLRRKDSSPLDILKGRLARGEVTAQEFERLRALIRDEALAKPKRADDDEATVDAVEYEQIRSAVNRHRRIGDDDNG